MKRFIVLLLLVGVLIATAGLYVRSELDAAGPGESTTIEIPRGLRSRGVVELLAQNNLIRNKYAALAYIFYSRTYNKLQAGEYTFEDHVTTREIVRKLTSGEVYLHKFTVAEGLTLKQTAQKWEEQGFGTAEDFLQAASGAIDLVRNVDDKASSVEGYLFPETYSFPKGTTSRQAIASMIDRFREMVARLKQMVPESSWPHDLHDTTIVASLVESEAAHSEERPIIASVYLNRLSRKILLQCDPTVIYALDLANKYRGTLTLADLRFNSPYNTYVTPGLPPGPIMSPGYASLVAAVQPASTNYLYFVRTDEGRHTFSETLADHNRAVAAYRKLQQAAKRNSKG
jgi:peptidoglycan lytic transglycosylase G